jgi:hypothetical protein
MLPQRLCLARWVALAGSMPHTTESAPGASLSVDRAARQPPPLRRADSGPAFGRVTGLRRGQQIQRPPRAAVSARPRTPASRLTAVDDDSRHWWWSS